MPKKKKEDKEYRKLGERKPWEFTDPIFISNAGLIILAPYLGMLFDKCELISDGKFIDAESRYKAVQLLQFAVTGTTVMQEYDLILNRLMCGMDITAPLDLTQIITNEEKEIVVGLLVAVTQHWSALYSSSIESLRVTFLQRDGKLEDENGTYNLKVEQKAYDMLLDQIPWNISKISLSWMNKTLEVLWR